jgi:hypothetical protein
MSEESDRMMVLLQELAALKKAQGKGRGVISRKRRKEISQEMKQLASRSKNNESGNEPEV